MNNPQLSNVMAALAVGAICLTAADEAEPAGKGGSVPVAVGGVAHGSTRSYSVVGRISVPGTQGIAVAVSREDFWRGTPGSVVDSHLRIETGYLGGQNVFVRRGSLTIEDAKRLITAVEQMLQVASPAAGFQQFEATFTVEGAFTLRRSGDKWSLSEWVGGSTEGLVRLRELLLDALTKANTLADESPTNRSTE